MTNRKNFVKLAAIACCLLIPSFSSTQVVNGQKGQLPDKRRGGADDYVLIEGDIQVSPSFYQQLVTAARSPQAAPIRHLTRLWPNGVVPFEFDGNVIPANQTIMTTAMGVLGAVANVNFRNCANNNCSGDYVHIEDSEENSSAVGVKGGEQKIKINDWNIPGQPINFIIVHELLHCLGFIHEQSRPDRDNYVRPICENVEDGCNGNTYRDNFTISSDATSYGYYDFDSVMHYRQCAFSENNNCPGVSVQFPDGGITVQVREPYNTQWQSLIGQRNHLSDLDRATVSFLYPFPDWRFLDTSYNGGNGPSNGSFYRPYTSFNQAVANTPEGGTIWLLRTPTIPAFGNYGKQIRVRAAPGVIGTLGG